MEVKKIVEAALFLSPRPLTLKELADLAKAKPEDILAAIDVLRSELEERGSALVVEQIGNAYRLSVSPEVYPYVAHLSPVPEFSKAELRLLAEMAVEGKIPMSRVKRLKNWEQFLEKVLKLGVVRREKKGKAVYLVKTPLFEKYFSLTEEL